MAYAFAADDPDLAAAVRRVAREEAEAALAQARSIAGGEGDPGPRIHAMRKSVKKLRGLLRLVHPAMRAARAENGALRDMGRRLSATRDAAVQRDALARLLDGAGGEAWMEGERAALLAPFAAAQAEAESPEALARAAEGFAEEMAAFAGRAEGWRLRRKGWEALGPGVEATWDAARAALREALDDPSPEPIHELRKRAKDHWYQARLLQPIWPAAMDPHEAAADDLCERLGEAGDLAVLRDRLAAAPLPEGLRARALRLAEEERARRLAVALPLAQRLLAGGGGALARRWGTWWRLWREGAA